MSPLPRSKTWHVVATIDAEVHSRAVQKAICAVTLQRPTTSPDTGSPLITHDHSFVHLICMHALSQPRCHSTLDVHAFNVEVYCSILALGTVFSPRGHGLQLSLPSPFLLGSSLQAVTTTGAFTSGTSSRLFGLDSFGGGLLKR